MVVVHDLKIVLKRFWGVGMNEKEPGCVLAGVLTGVSSRLAGEGLGLAFLFSCSLAWDGKMMLFMLLPSVWVWVAEKMEGSFCERSEPRSEATS